MKTLKASTFLIAGLLLVVAVTGANVAQAQSCSVSWTNNTGDFLWSTAGNWSTNQVPGPMDDVCIPTSSADARGVSSISIHSLQISQNASVQFGSGTVSIATPVTLPGSLGLSGTTLSVPSVNVLSVTGQFPAVLGGYGTFEGSVTNSGDFEADTATLTVTGDYTQTSSGRIDATWPGFGLTPPYGLIQVEGNVTLSGSLGVRTDVPKFPPKSGSTFTVMTFDGSLSGKFTEVLPNTVTAKYEKDSVLAQYH